MVEKIFFCVFFCMWSCILILLSSSHSIHFKLNKVAQLLWEFFYFSSPQFPHFEFFFFFLHSVILSILLSSFVNRRLNKKKSTPQFLMFLSFIPPNTFKAYKTLKKKRGSFFFLFIFQKKINLILWHNLRVANLK